MSDKRSLELGMTLAKKDSQMNKYAMKLFLAKQWLSSRPRWQKVKTVDHHPV